MIILRLILCAGFYERVLKSLNVVTKERCKVYFQSAERYMKLYQDGVSGRDIPEAMKQQRKNRKHRPGGLHPEEAESSRGKNSYKKQRLEKIEAMLDNE